MFNFYLIKLTTNIKSYQGIIFLFDHLNIYFYYLINSVQIVENNKNKKFAKRFLLKIFTRHINNNSMIKFKKKCYCFFFSSHKNATNRQLVVNKISLLNAHLEKKDNPFHIIIDNYNYNKEAYLNSVECREEITFTMISSIFY